MKTKEWKASNVDGGEHLGAIELEHGVNFACIATETRIVFGGACNAGFLESGYIEREEFESLDETIFQLAEDLETYYRDGAQYVSRIVCNQRM